MTILVLASKCKFNWYLEDSIEIVEILLIFNSSLDVQGNDLVININSIDFESNDLFSVT